MKISYIIPHRNRTSLLHANLASLAAQTCKDFEVIIIDNSDAVEWESLKHICAAAKTAGTDIKCYRIDPSLHPESHPKHQCGGAYNPALAQNIGAKKASGDILVLTSPEVVNARTNIENIIKAFESDDSKFVLGWIDEKHPHQVGALGSGISAEQIKELCRVPGNGAMCREDVPHRPWLPENYFLGCMLKQDFIRIGGVDERFMRSIAYDDNCFAQCCMRNNIPIQINTSIVGLHLSHSRSYQQDLNNPNKDLWMSIKDNVSISNDGINWGDSAYIIEEWV